MTEEIFANKCFMKHSVSSLFFQHKAGISQEAIQFQNLVPKLLGMNLDKHMHCRTHLSWFTICLVNSITLSHTSQKRVWRKTGSMQGHAQSMEWDDPDTAIQLRELPNSAEQTETDLQIRERLSPAQIFTDSRSKVQCYQCSKAQERSVAVCTTELQIKLHGNVCNSKVSACTGKAHSQAAVVPFLLYKCDCVCQKV